jgi:hypothetical protein
MTCWSKFGSSGANLSLFADTLAQFRSMVLTGDYASLTSVVDMISSFPWDPLLDAEISESTIAKDFLDSLTFAQVTEENASLLRILLPTLCRLFWLADLDNAGGKLARDLPLGDFIDSLLLFAPHFAEDRDLYLWYCCLFANIARLRDSVLGEAYHGVLMVAISRPDLLGPDEGLLLLAIEEVENFAPTLSFRAPPICDAFLDCFTAFALVLGACADLDDSQCAFLLSALDGLCHHYPEHCAALIASEIAPIIALAESFEPRDNSAVLIGHLLNSIRELVVYGEPRPRWTLQELEQLRLNAGPEASYYVFGMYRSLLCDMPDCGAEFGNPATRQYWIDTILGEMKREDASLRVRTQAGRLLVELLTCVWKGDEFENLRTWFDDIVALVLDFLELEPKAACAALQIFVWFAGWQVLDFSQEPDQRFLMWLDEWGEESACSSDELANLVADCRDRFSEETIRLTTFE